MSIECDIIAPIASSKFISHWNSVDADRVANTLPVLTLQGGYTRPLFVADRAILLAAISATEGLENARELATGNRDAQKTQLRERMTQFRAAVELHLKQTAYPGATPTLPPLSLAESKFLRPFDDMQDLWERINADAAIPGFTGPLLLRAGYTLANFSAELAGLRTQFAAVTEAENGLSIGRRQRDALLPPLRERLLQYRAAIELEYAPGHPLYESLPSLSPAPGSTPDPVTASGFWEPSPGHAVLSWSASTNPDLDHYSIRMSPGPSYDSATASVIGSQPPGSAGTTTLAGLANPGDIASFKIFVVLTTGNEAGSNTVTITRMS